MEMQARSMELEIDQAHNLLDQYGIDRIDPDSMMILSLRGRLELLIDRARLSDEVY